MKRARGEGNIQPRGDAWRIRYRINGKRFEKTVKGSRSDAAKALRAALKAGDDGRHVAPGRLTLGAWIEDWLALKARSLAGQTLDRYADLLRPVALGLGGQALQALTATDIDRFYGQLTLAPGTQGLLHRVLKSCLATAVKKKVLAHNPVDDAERPRAPQDECGTVLDEADLATLVRGFEGHSLYGIVAVASYTGMRKGEVLALHWTDVDLTSRQISISRNVQETRTPDGSTVRSIKRPKTARGRRTIEIDEPLAALLRSLPRWGELVFPEIGGTGLRSPHSVYVMFAKRARALGFRLRFHDLRASHSTILLDRGVPVHVVAKRIGDDPATLLKSYAKRTKKADASAAQVIAGISELALGPNTGASASVEAGKPLI